MWLLDRAAGKGLAISLYESEEALRASEQAADKLRKDAVGQIPTGNVISVGQFCR